jgi:NAD(P)-dependent dehydrogenase (short-subunit alcohol dehydrogenase family)
MAGRAVLVTGGSRGIGADVAHAFAAARDRVAVHFGMSAGGARRVADELPGEGHVVVGADLADPEAVRRMVEEAAAGLGGIDVLVNNAGLYAGLRRGAFFALAEAEWDRVMAVNVKGTWLCATACVPVMREQGVGAIVNIASTTAINGSAGFAHYVASKGAVIALTRSMAREVGPLGIRVNVIAPGFTLTDASRELFEQEGRDPETYALDRSSLKRPAQPEDVFGAALWLAGDGAGYVTGQTIVVDGGRIFV